jgi:hypothetical protein
VTIPFNRNPRSPRILAVRPLTEADLEYLRQPSARGRIANIKDSHHNLARLCALGLSNNEVADRLGYSIGRVSILRHDPSVVELIAHYRELVTENFVEVVDEFQRTAVANMAKAERMISDKIDEADANNETLPMRELIAITSDRMDRFGYGKKSLNLNVNVDFAAKLEAAISRSKKVAAS